MAKIKCTSMKVGGKRMVDREEFQSSDLTTFSAGLGPDAQGNLVVKTVSANFYHEDRLYSLEIDAETLIRMTTGWAHPLEGK